jgi:hypothetical protein
MLQENDQMKWIWVFTGGGTFPAGVFETREQAEDWIKENGVEGCLTRYPVGASLFDYAIRMAFFEPKRDNQKTPKFKAEFSCAYLEHYHYEIDETTGTYNENCFLNENTRKQRIEERGCVKVW